ncbi:MAG: hypothetical protein PHC91_00390, partial [Eubacteriales bacterium]|nr:hypothetical protein [Eubacteriales bacterium]
ANVFQQAERGEFLGFGCLSTTIRIIVYNLIQGWLWIKKYAGNAYFTTFNKAIRNVNLKLIHRSPDKYRKPFSLAV